MMDLDQLRQILDLVREHELAEFEIEHDGLRLKIRKDAAGTPVVTLPAAPPAPIVLPTAAPAAVPLAASLAVPGRNASGRTGTPLPSAVITTASSGTAAGRVRLRSA